MNHFIYNSNTHSFWCTSLWVLKNVSSCAITTIEIHSSSDTSKSFHCDIYPLITILSTQVKLLGCTVILTIHLIFLNEILQYIDFWVWLPLLILMHLKFIHVVAYSNALLLLLLQSSISVCRCTIVCLSIIYWKDTVFFFFLFIN